MSALEVNTEGIVHAPEGPGLGAAIDFDRIKSRTVEGPAQPEIGVTITWIQKPLDSRYLCLYSIAAWP